MMGLGALAAATPPVHEAAASRLRGSGAPGEFYRFLLMQTHVGYRLARQLVV